MATIQGPNVQAPQALVPFVDENGVLGLQAATFLNALQAITFYSTRSGPTASRPTSSSYRWVGMPFYDVTLGLPVFLHIASSNVWHKADGTVA